MKKLKYLVATIITATGLAWQASAVTVINADYLFGTVIPGTPAGDAIETTRLNHLINVYNGVPSVPPDGNLYTLSPGANVPPPPLPSASLVSKTETSNPLVDLGAFTYEYLSAKFGTDTAYYYIGQVSGEIQILPPSGWTGGISHFSLYNQGDTPRVPDGGATVMLLGVALAGLGAARRFLRS